MNDEEKRNAVVEWLDAIDFKNTSHPLLIFNQDELEHLAQCIIERDKSRDQQIALAERNDLLFDLDEIENKPWRVFRQLAEIMPDYAGIYTEYQAFYSYGGGREVKKLIEEFKKTDDYKNSGYPEMIAKIKPKQEEEL